MALSIIPELYSSVQAYAHGEISRAELEDWLVPHLEELLQPWSTAQELVAEIELDLAEHSHGDITEQELKERLSKFLEKNAKAVR